MVGAGEQTSASTLGALRPRTAPAEIDWNTLDKRAFLLNSVGVFTAVTTALYPLSVLKTRQQAGVESSTLGAIRSLARAEGVRGLYRGYSTVLLGSLPVRGLYLSVLEATKAASRQWEPPPGLVVPEALRTGAADFVAGATASCVTQCLVIPVDVVSQRLMVQPNPGTGAGAVVYRNGFAAARGILATEGLRGLYRGAGVSLAIFVPSSGLWWGAYGAYQRTIWSALASWRGPDAALLPADIVPVQTGAALCAGATSGLLTTPLDVIKTRLQTMPFDAARPRPTFRSVASQVMQQEGAAGFLRGVVPRVSSTMLWGTCMVSAFELLKRISVRREVSGDAATKT